MTDQEECGLLVTGVTVSHVNFVIPGYFVAIDSLPKKENEK
jgi:hypothetical protein